MIDPKRPLESISDGLIDYLRQALDHGAIEYDRPLTQLQGGYQTSTYRFKLRGAGGKWAKPLVLRLYPRYCDAESAVWESTIQNILVDQGYPAARVLLTCADTAVLGGAFLVMELVEGVPMMNAPNAGVPPTAIPGLLADAHAALHDVDPGPLRAVLQKQGVDERRYTFVPRLEALKDRAAPYPWLRDAVDWLMVHCPPQPKRLSICHGDFHPLNLMVREGRVTGVLDWSGLMIADPAADVATTVILTTVSARYILGLSEWEPAVNMYLDAYRAHRPLDLQHMDYYKARRCVIALVDGAGGQSVWQHPAIVQDLIANVRAITGIHITHEPVSRGQT